jgi:hypothetical protein
MSWWRPVPRPKVLPRVLLLMMFPPVAGRTDRARRTLVSFRANRAACRDSSSTGWGRRSPVARDRVLQVKLVFSTSVSPFAPPTLRFTSPQSNESGESLIELRRSLLTPRRKASARCRRRRSLETARTSVPSDLHHLFMVCLGSSIDCQCPGKRPSESKSGMVTETKHCGVSAL